jgi:RND family efflux transporter MFP subunit
MNELKTVEDQLRAEIGQLKLELEQQKRLAEGGPSQKPSRPSRLTLTLLGIVLLVLVVAGFFRGYLPRQRREEVLVAEAKTTAESLPVVNVQQVKRSSAENTLLLPGNIQAITEAPVMARSTGYVLKRYVDIGDRVQAGQVLAEIEAPELDDQIRQAQATIDQLKSTVQQAQASLEQGQSNANLARVTAQRWANLVAKGVVSKQENDTYQAQYESQQANVHALEKALAAAQSNVAASQANLARFDQLKTYQTVRAPFAGVITLRNVDTGVLVNEGNTMLFRIAQTDRLRTFLNVPQVNAAAVKVGQAATLLIPDLPGRKFPARVSHTASALDPSTRTLLVEVEAANREGALMPGMYAQVDLALPNSHPPLLIPGDTLVVRPDGPQTAVVAADGRVHFARIQLGRDFGDHLEVLAGLEEGQQVVVNPGDNVREGVRVKPVSASAPASDGKRQ